MWLQLDSNPQPLSLKTNTQLFTQTSDFTPALNKVFLDIQATIKCGFTLKHVRDMIITYSKCNNAKEKKCFNSGLTLTLCLPRCDAREKNYNFVL